MKRDEINELAGVMPIMEFAKDLGVSRSAVRNWVITGRLSVKGVLVKMEYKRMPYGRGCSMAMYNDFIRKLSDDGDFE